MNDPLAVAIKCAVVAAGTVKRKSADFGDKLHLKLTFVLTPAKPDTTGGPVVDLRLWPKAVSDLVTAGAFKAGMARAALSASGLAVPAFGPGAWSVLADPLQKAFEEIVGASRQQKRTVLNLWEALCNDAALGIKGGQGTADELLAQVAALFAKTISSEPNSGFLDANALPLVLGTGRSDAAILTLIHRTEILLARLQQDKTRRDIPAQRVELDSETRNRWIQKMEALVASDKQPGPGQPGDPEQGKALLREYEELERDAVDRLARELAAGDSSFLEALRSRTTSGDALPARAEALRGEAPATLFPVDTNTGPAWEQVQTKHLAALLNDWQEASDEAVKSRLGKRYGKAFDAESDQFNNDRLESDASYIAQTFIANIRNSPLLSRLFRFVIDFELPVPEDLQQAVAAGPVFLHLAGSLAAAPERPVPGQIVTLSKLGRVARTTPFWPATREEAEALLRGQSPQAASQIDGLINLGEQAGGLGEVNPRYDLVTIDPVVATDAICRRARRHAMARDPAVPGSEELADIFQEQEETGLLSKGLAIVDRWRGAAVAQEIITAQQAVGATGAVLLDAADMTSGFRVDVSVRTGGTPEWRSLMEREIDYRRAGQEGSHGDGDDFSRWFHRLAFKQNRKLEPGSSQPAVDSLVFEEDHRRELDAAVMMPASRRRRRPPQSGQADEMIHAEDLLVGWDGDPLGLSCGENLIAIPAGADLGMTRRYDLPRETSEAQFKAFPLRYGWAYRFRMRPVWMGGVSLSKAEADVRAQLGTKGLTLPADRSLGGTDNRTVQGWRRFLRHHAIRAPIVLLFRSEAERSARPPEGEMVLPSQSGSRVLLRSLRTESDLKPPFSTYAAREQALTSRIILPPRISLDEALRHGRFDRVSSLEAAQQGDFLDMNYDAKVPLPAGKKAKDAVQATSFPAFESTETGSDPAKPRQRTPYFELRPRSNAAAKRAGNSCYYVDPMISALVIAVRPNGGRPGQPYFPGKPAVIPLSLGAAGQRVRINFVALRNEIRAPGDEVTQESFMVSAAEAARLGVPAPVKTEAANDITICLRAGESVDVDCWYVPSEQQLRAAFDWPESIAVLLSARHPIAPGERQDQYRRRLITRLVDLLAEAAGRAGLSIDAITTLIDTYKAESAWIGMAGQVADPAVVAAAARVLHAHLLTMPLPEIAAVQTIDTIHAVARPPRKPALDPQRKLAIWRAPAKDADGRRTMLLKDLAVVAEGAAPEAGRAAVDPQERRYGRPGDESFVIGGIARLDRDTCRQLEIRAYATSPSIHPLDDIKRGRTELQRLLGEWPERIVPAEPELQPSAETASGPGKARITLSRKARELYGFDVDTAGHVTFPRQWSTLLQIDDLEEHRIGATPAELVKAFTDLEDVTLAGQQLLQQSKAPDAAAVGAIRAWMPDSYSDGLARRFQIVLRATSRFDPYFLRLDRTSAQPVPETVFPSDPNHAEIISRWSHETHGRAPEGVTLYDAALSKPDDHSAMQTLWLPATVAPARPVVDTVLPTVAPGKPKTTAAQDRDELCREVSRMPKIRIYLDRPWFSSGEGERLGLILWPPKVPRLWQAEQAPAPLAEGKIPRAVLGPAAADEVMDLSTFEDEDLGPGGRFTTRWAADPIRDAKGPTGPFLYWANLLGNKSTPPVADPAETTIGYIDSIEIPLVDLRDWQNTNHGSNAELPEVETITAALATYAPKFDVEREKWFVDIELEPGCLVEPFLRLGLVRYQPQAHPKLRVSSPVAVWAQVPLVRTVRVRHASVTRKTEMDESPLEIHVEVSGYAARRAVVGAHKIDALPRMKISIGARQEGGVANIPLESLVPLHNGHGSASCWVAGDQIIGPCKWTHSFTVQRQQAADLFVTVEEADEFLATANMRFLDGNGQRPAATQPESFEDDGPELGVSRSGPRFLARINLT